LEVGRDFQRWKPLNLLSDTDWRAFVSHNSRFTCECNKEDATDRPTLEGNLRNFSSYTKVYSVIYDSGSIPEYSIFSPRGTSPEPTSLHPHISPLSLKAHCVPRQVSYQVNNYKTDPFIGALSARSKTRTDSETAEETRTGSETAEERRTGSGNAGDVPDAAIVYTSLNHARKVHPTPLILRFNLKICNLKIS